MKRSLFILKSEKWFPLQFAMSESDESATRSLTELLRRHGFFENMDTVSVPLVSHLFSEYVQLKASVAQFKTELLELKDASSM